MAGGLLAISAHAQILKGDMNEDGILNVTDLNATTATILGEQEKKIIYPGGDPFTINNSLVAGYWYHTESDKFTLMEDGRTDYPGATTFQFMPYSCRIVFLNANGEPVSRMSVIRLENGCMWGAPNGQSSVVAYNAKQQQPVTSIQLSATQLDMAINETKQLTATLLPADANYRVVTWTSSNESVVKVTGGTILAVNHGTATITCSATDGSGVKATCEVKVERDYVDLGLPGGVLWATCNVGAEKPEEYGLLFAWGDTKGYKENEIGSFPFTQGLYKFRGNYLSKYCVDSNYGIADNKTKLDPEDDAATANWGEGWRMPTFQEIKDLYNSNYTYTEWVTVNGVTGRKITSRKNGNSIFLPAASRMGSFFSEGEDGLYWTSEMASKSSMGYILEFKNYDMMYTQGSRYFGLPVRPVRVSTK